MEKIIFSAQIKQFNRKALASNDTQIRLILDCYDKIKEQNQLMKDLSDIELGQEIVTVQITKTNDREEDL